MRSVRQGDNHETLGQLELINDSLHGVLSAPAPGDVTTFELEAIPVCSDTVCRGENDVETALVHAMNVSDLTYVRIPPQNGQ